MRVAYFPGMVAALAAWLSTASAEAQCKTDVECKGDRVCEGGVCVDPAGAPTEALPTQEPPSAQPPVEAPPEAPPEYGPPPTQYEPHPYPYPYYPPPPPGYQAGLDPRLLPAEAVKGWQEGDPIPPGYGTTTTFHKGLVIAGAVTLGAMWVASIAAYAMLIEEDDRVTFDDGSGNFVTIEDDAEERWAPLVVPVVGPFIAIGTSEDTSAAPYLVIDGVAQVGGLTMLIVGLVMKKEKLVWVGDLEIAPLVGRQNGVAVGGSF
jgi:hypothetical protein